MQKLIAKDLLSIKAVFFRPEDPFTWASGIKSPVYCDNRLTLTAPKVRTDVEQGLAKLIKENTGVKYSRTISVTGSFEPYLDLYQYKATAYHREMGWDKMMDLAREFIDLKTDKPAVFYVWGHSYEFDADNSWDDFENICKDLSGRDDVFYGTNREVLL